MKSPVYFSRLKNGESHKDCLQSLLGTIGSHFSEIGAQGIIGIKMSVREEHSTGYIMPELVRIVVDTLTAQGARPFVFDTNVIYKGKRQNAVDHLNLAYNKGFTPENIGCPYIIADSVFGTDSRALKVNFKNVKEIRVPSLAGILDDLIVLTHITGHLLSGFAGSVKNVAMGMASRAGKQVQHSSIKPSIDTHICTMCGSCIEACPESAISEHSGTAYVNQNLCAGCGECIACCKLGAVNINWREEAHIFAERMSEYATGILSRVQRKLFLNFALDITKECDCIAGDDPRIIRDTGVFASQDILSVDRATYDMLTKRMDLFSRGGKISAHKHLFKYGQEIGLGSLDYELHEVGM